MVTVLSDALRLEIGIEHFGRQRDIFVPVDGQWLIHHRFVSTDWNARASMMAQS